jgi:hypothetical protein
MSFFRRIGIFLIMLGLGLIGYFVFTDLAHQASFGILVIGAIALIGGIAIQVGNPVPEAHPNPRFRTLNKIIKRDDEIEGKKK